MKRKTLTTAVLAGLTGVAGMVGVSNAVNLNPDGLGQVLVYPYYTARSGNDTLISVVNTTDQAKAVKLRILEGRNSREVLDFNIYMSAYDVWTGAVTETANGEGGELVIRDKTCTVPYFVGSAPGGIARVPFSTVEFATFPGDDRNDGAGQGPERTKSGYIEIIEMGTLVDDNGVDPAQDSATAATHVNGIPADCDQLVTAWTRPAAGPGPANYWLDGTDTDDLENPSGGLFGSASIINVNNGTLLSYNAEAIDNWSSFAIQHTDPSATIPQIIDMSPDPDDAGFFVSNVFISGGANVDQRRWFDGRDAVNAILMRNQILNEYAVSPNTDGLTEWVLTHPTKRFSVDSRSPTVGSTAVPPFSVLFNSDEDRPGTSCEPIVFRLWDREEIELREAPGNDLPPRPSPLPPTPPPEVDTFDLCYEANVVRFIRADAVDGSPVVPDDNEAVAGASPEATEILGEVRFTTLFMPSSFISGWAQFDFDPGRIDPLLSFPATARRISDADGVDYVGLPTVGFQASTVTNNTIVVDGNAVLSNYGGTFKHRGSRKIEATPTPQP